MTAPQGPASTAQEEQAPRPASTARPATGPWSNYPEVGNSFYQDALNQPRTRDVRLPREVHYRWLAQPLPRIHLWASTYFEDESITHEGPFIKAWLRAAFNHDHGLRRIWLEYCEARGDGTQDPNRVRPIFARIYFFLYCSREENFFTQHRSAKILSLDKEEQLVREAAADFVATHLNYRAPRINWPPEEFFATNAQAQGTPSNAPLAPWPDILCGPHGPAQHFRELREEQEAAAERREQHATAASSWQGTPHWWGDHQGGWDWTPQQGGWGSGW